MTIKQVLCAFLLICFTASPFALAKDDLRAEMEAANKAWLMAYNNMDGAAFAPLYAKDATVLPPGAPPVNGAEAIGQFWAERIKPGNRKNHTFEIVSIERDGKYAYQVARWTLDVIKEKGEAMKLAGNTVRVFEMQPDGKWLTKVHIF